MITEQEMKIQRVLGVATYVKVINLDDSMYKFSLFSYINPKKYLEQYGQLFDNENKIGTLFGSPLYPIKFEDGKILYLREDDFKII